VRDFSPREIKISHRTGTVNPPTEYKQQGQKMVANLEDFPQNKQS
jgi:hypothetical protein